MRKRKNGVKLYYKVNLYPQFVFPQSSVINTGSAENEEDFSWEDDEEDVTAAAQSPKIAKGVKAMDDSTSSEGTLGLKPKPSLKPTKDSAPPSQAATSATTSPRLSSEDSFDLVSSGNVSNTGDTKAPTKKGDDDDADSDWE